MHLKKLMIIVIKNVFIVQICQISGFYTKFSELVLGLEIYIGMKKNEKFLVDFA